MRNAKAVDIRQLFSWRSGLLAFLLSAVVLGRPAIAQTVYSSSSSYASYLIDAKGNLYAWGDDYYNHTFAAKAVPQDSLPVLIPFPSGVTRWTDMATGFFQNLAVGNDGNIYAWGNNGNGQLGDGTTTSTDTLVKVSLPNGAKAVQVACAWTHSLALGSDGNIYAFGFNNNGQLGDSTTTASSTPVRVHLPVGFTPSQIYAGWYYSAALGKDSTVYVWGGNAQGQLGLGNTTKQLVPIEVPFPQGVTKWTGVYCGLYFMVLKGNDGNLYASGTVGVTSYGQLGTGKTTASDSLVKVQLPAGVTGWKTAACTGSAVLAVANNDSVYGWGYNGDGALGNGQSGIGTNLTPTVVNLPAGVTVSSLAAGRDHVLAVGSDNTYFAWGQGSQGQLGNGGFDVTVPTPGRVFGVLQKPLTTPVPSSPYNTAVNQALDVTLQWGAVNSADGYQCEVSTDPTFNTGMIANDSTLKVPADTIKALSYSTKYYWRVRAYENGVLGAFNGAYSFTTMSNLPPAPGLVFPKLSTVGIPREVTFQWKPSPSASQYRIQVSTSTQAYTSGDSAGEFTSLIADTTVADTSVQLAAPLAANTIYYWHVSAIDTNGMGEFSSNWEFKTGVGLTAVNEPNGLPKTFALMQNYPNPFNPTTMITYSLPKAQMVTLEVYNVLGEKVATLVNAHQSAGVYEVNFNADRFASGVYLYILRTNNFSAVHKMLFLK